MGRIGEAIREQIQLLGAKIADLESEVAELKAEIGQKDPPRTCAQWLNSLNGLVSNIDLLALWDFDTILREAQDICTTPTPYTFREIVTALVDIRAKMQADASEEFSKSLMNWLQRYG